jgi:hypothetical protein
MAKASGFTLQQPTATNCDGLTPAPRAFILPEYPAQLPLGFTEELRYWNSLSIAQDREVLESHVEPITRGGSAGGGAGLKLVTSVISQLPVESRLNVALLVSLSTGWDCRIRKSTSSRRDSSLRSTLKERGLLKS